MKKLIAAIALMMSLMLVLPVMAEGTGLRASSFSGMNMSSAQADGQDDVLQAKNAQFLQNFLDSRNYIYEKRSDNVFMLDFTIDGAYPSAQLWLTVYDNGVQCEVTCDVTVDAGAMAELCRYAMYVNSTQRSTLFYLDKGNELWSVNFCLAGPDGMDEESFSNYYVSALTRWEVYGQDFKDILEGNKTAAELMN
ncbi:MAG: hypothetical protein E7331_05795 [Clostridiales bacterium]|nr:hypothetical protein [Clostridiales bacterium]